MPVVSPPSPSEPCRRYQLLRFTIACLLMAAGPARVASYQALPGLYPVNPAQSLPQYYYPNSPKPSSPIESSTDNLLPSRPRGAPIYSDRPAAELQQRMARAQPGADNVVVGKWASRNSVSKTHAQAYLASPSSGANPPSSRNRFAGRRTFEPMPPFVPPPSGTLLPDLSAPHLFNWSSSIIGRGPGRSSAAELPGGASGAGAGLTGLDHEGMPVRGAEYGEKPYVQQNFNQAGRHSASDSDAQAQLATPVYYVPSPQNKRKRVVETADLSLGGYDRGLAKAGRSRNHQRPARRAFESMPPFQPPPSGTILPDLFSPHLFNWSSDAIGQRPAWPSAPAPGPGAVPVDGHADRRPNYRGLHREEFLPATGEGYAEKMDTQLRRFGQASRNSISRNDTPYLAPAHGVTVRNNRKRAVETADMSLGDYDRRQLMRRGKRRQRDRGQIFEPMPPFVPPPTGTILPDLFSPHLSNWSSRIIGQRPTRPSATKPGVTTPGGTTPGSDAADRGRLPGDRGFLSEDRGPEPSPQGPGRTGPAGTHQLESQGPTLFSHVGGRTGQTGEPPADAGLPGEGEGVWNSRDPEGPSPDPGQSRQFGRPSTLIPPIRYEELPSPRSEYTDAPDAQPEQFNPRDVLVKIETRRLHLTYSVNAPPYFTFEGLLSQLATYLMPGFCVDLAVTRRDERCEIVSHMAALKTDRQQNWLIEIVDTGGKIIWMNQCMPDARLFIVPGFRVRFKFGTHTLVPEETPPVSSTQGDVPEDTEPAFGPQETARTPVGLPVSDDGWKPYGPPYVPQRQTSENS